jgi:Mrp family chromosome partitioning ATPase
MYLDVLEAMRRFSILPAREGDAGRGAAPILAVTSPASRDGKSYVASTLANQLAAGGEGRVLLLDASAGNDGSPTAALAAEQESGWPEVVRGEARLGDVLRVEVEPMLDVLPVSRLQDGAALLRDPRFFALLDEVRRRYHLVVADCLSLTALPVGLDLLRRCDGILLVLSYGENSSIATRECLERLDDAQGRVIGAIINRRRFPTPSFLYHRL